MDAGVIGIQSELTVHRADRIAYIDAGQSSGFEQAGGLLPDPVKLAVHPLKGLIAGACF